MKGKIVHLTILWAFLLTVGGVVLVGVYNLPDQQVQIKGDVKDLAEFQLSYMANQISVLNYFLTFIGIAGAIAGVAFTIFGYYQSTKFPEMVKTEVEMQIEQFKQEEQVDNESIINNLEWKERMMYLYIFETLLSKRVHHKEGVDKNLDFEELCELYLDAAYDLAYFFRENKHILKSLIDATRSEILRISSNAYKTQYNFVNTDKDKEKLYRSKVFTIRSKLDKFEDILRNQEIPSPIQRKKEK